MNQRQAQPLFPGWLGVADNWQRFALVALLLMGLMLVVTRAEPVGAQGLPLRLSFWLCTALGVYACLRVSVLGAGRLPLSAGWPQLIATSMGAAVLYALPSWLLDRVFGFVEEETGLWNQLWGEVVGGFGPITLGCCVALLPSVVAGHANGAGEVPSSPERPELPGRSSEPTAAGTRAPQIPTAAGTEILKVVADLQYLHVYTARGMSTVPGPLREMAAALGDRGVQLSRSLWVADVQVRQIRNSGGRWLCVTQDAERLAISRRRVAEVRQRYGDTLFNDRRAPR